MKTQLLTLDGKKTQEITLPKIFSGTIREDVVQKVLEAKKRRQPYSPSPIAGHQQSDRGKIRHRRHVWQTHYGRGLARVPRKVMSRRGTQFNWEASGIPGVKGGPRAHPPKVIAMMTRPQLNKKEVALAFSSALSATFSPAFVQKRYATLKDKKLTSVGFVVDSSLTSLSSKDLVKSIKTIVGDLYDLCVQKRTQRAGKGTMRGRKYKRNAGLLIVVGEKEKLKSAFFDVVRVNELGVTDLAKGGLGRLTIYTKQAIETLEKRI